MVCAVKALFFRAVLSLPIGKSENRIFCTHFMKAEAAPARRGAQKPTAGIKKCFGKFCGQIVEYDLAYFLYLLESKIEGVDTMFEYIYDQYQAFAEDAETGVKVPIRFVNAKILNSLNSEERKEFLADAFVGVYEPNTEYSSANEFYYNGSRIYQSPDYAPWSKYY